VRPIIEFSGIKTRGQRKKNQFFSLFSLKTGCLPVLHHDIHILFTTFLRAPQKKKGYLPFLSPIFGEKFFEES
jgi:hypothetical protein